MNIVLILMAVIFLALGIIIKYLKCYFLIAGYNTMTKEEQSRVDIEKTANIMGNAFFIIALFQGIAILFSLFNKDFIAIIISLFSIFIVILVTIIISQKYDGNAIKKDGTLNKSNKITIIVISIFMILIMLFVYISLFGANKTAQVVIGDNKIIIEGQYGITIPLENILDVSLNEKLPKVINKTNGSDLGSKLKGNFTLEGIGKAKLFLDKKNTPFIFINSKDGLIIINQRDKEETIKLYEKIRLEIK